MRDRTDGVSKIFQKREVWDPGSIGEQIYRYRRLVLVHSIIYYKLNDNLLTDYEYDSFSKNLARLQKDYPDISEKVLYHRRAFRDFEGSTGAFLPLDDPGATKIAADLIRKRDDRAQD